jgi:predicted Zn-dependent protease
MAMNLSMRWARSGLVMAALIVPAWACSSSSSGPTTAASAAATQQAADDKAKVETGIADASDKLHQKLLDGNGGEMPSADVQRYVQKFAATLLIKADMGDVSLYLVDSTDVNHFAIPGRIYLTRGLLGTLDNDAQLAAVIECEVSHLKLGHVRKKIDDARDKAGQGLGGMFGGATKFDAIVTSAFGVDSDGHYGAMYTESDEYDAAKDAIPRMAAAGYDPNQYHVFLEKMLDAKAKALTTHASSYQQATKVEVLTTQLFPTPDPTWKVGADTYKAEVGDKVKALPPPTTQK